MDCILLNAAEIKLCSAKASLLESVFKTVKTSREQKNCSARVPGAVQQNPPEGSLGHSLLAPP